MDEEKIKKKGRKHLETWVGGGDRGNIGRGRGKSGQLITVVG